MNCICQRIYDTGFSGIARIDARLRHQYEVYGEDCIRRAYDHANKRIPYSDVPRKPYCHVTKTKGACAHDSCEHSRYRPPDTVMKMRKWIEEQGCKAAIHYPNFLDFESEGGVPPNYGGVSYETLPSKWNDDFGIPSYRKRKRVLANTGRYPMTLTCLLAERHEPNDEALLESEAWEEAMHRLHKRLEAATPHRTVNYNGVKTQQLPLQRIDPSSFREYVAECLFGVNSMERGLLGDDEYDAAVERLNNLHEKFWHDGIDFSDVTDEELQAAYR